METFTISTEGPSTYHLRLFRGIAIITFIKKKNTVMGISCRVIVLLFHELHQLYLSRVRIKTDHHCTSEVSINLVCMHAYNVLLSSHSEHIFSHLQSMFASEAFPTGKPYNYKVLD